MKIKLTKILDTLQDLNIPYEFKSAPHEDIELEVASIFKPIEAGFYFAKNSLMVPSQVKGSLFIIDDSIIKNENNVFITVFENDPQQVFYLVLNSLFVVRSNGEISKMAVIHPDAKIGKNVQIDDFCVIGNCVIEDNVIIGSQSKIYENTVIGKNTIIESLSSIGTTGVAWIWNKEQTQRIVQPQLGGVEVGCNCFLGSNTIIVRGSANENTIVGNNSLLAPSCRIGHGTQIGDYVHFANNIATGGNTIIGDYSFVGSGCVFRPKTRIHPKTIIGAGSLIIKNTSKEGLTLMGSPAKEYKTKAKPKGMPKPKV